MENNQSNIGYLPQMPVCSGTFLTEINSDFSLPDYKSEVRRLLSTEATLIPKNDFLGNDGASVEGDVIYKLIYVGTDGALYCATLTDKYKLDVPFSFGAYSVNTDDVTLLTNCECEAVNSRVLGPRKLNVRARIVCRALALSPSLYTPRQIGAHNPANLEQKFEKVCAINARKLESEPIILNDLIPLDTDIDNVRIIDHSSSVLISECTSSGEMINARGEVFVKLIYCNDAQSDQALTMQRRLPFSASIKTSDSTPNACAAYGIVRDEQASVEENGIQLEIELSVNAMTQKNVEVSYISDAYSTDRQSECSYIELFVPEALSSFNSCLTQSEVLMLSDHKIDRNAQIIDCNATAHVGELKLENGRLCLLGECTYRIICHHEDEYSSKEITLPFRYETDGRADLGESELSDYLARVCVPSARARSDGERLYIDCELSFCVFTQAKKPIRLLESISFGEMLTKDNGGMTLCYPNSGATLWDVAKRYGEPIKKIKTQNGIPDNDDISKKKYIVI